MAPDTIVLVHGFWVTPRSWEHWVDMPQRVGDVLAPLIGAGPGEVVLHDNTTLNVYQAVHAAIGLRPDRRVIAISADDFPTDRYVVDGIAAATGHTVRHGFDHLDDVAVMVRSVIDYRTAELVDVAVETARAHAAGAMVVFHPVSPDLEKLIGGKPTARKVNDDGTFTLTTYEDGDGAPEGEYGVTIQWEAKPKEGKLSLGSEGAPAGRSLINEAKYGNPQKPFTKVTVKKGDKNDFEFDVE